MKYTKINLKCAKKVMFNEKEIRNIISEAYLTSERWENYVTNRIFVRRINQSIVEVVAGCVNDYGSWWCSGWARLPINQLSNSAARKVARIPIGEEVVIYR